MILSFVSMIVVTKAFSKSDQWAWYVCWLLPLFLVYYSAEELIVHSGLWPINTLGIACSVAGLAMSRRRFFGHLQEGWEDPGEPKSS